MTTYMRSCNMNAIVDAANP